MFPVPYVSSPRNCGVAACVVRGVLSSASSPSPTSWTCESLPTPERRSKTSTSIQGPHETAHKRGTLLDAPGAHSLALFSCDTLSGEVTVHLAYFNLRFHPVQEEKTEEAQPVQEQKEEKTEEAQSANADEVDAKQMIDQAQPHQADQAQPPAHVQQQQPSAGEVPVDMELGK
jgi:hypothetical protein